MKKAWIRFIGDVHGGYRPNRAIYNRLTTQAEYSLQVGDLGRDYGHLHRPVIDSLKHRVIAGNHENFDEFVNFDQRNKCYWRNQKHFLGDFGMWHIPDFYDIFYVRGGFSLNHVQKKIYRTWSEEEELSYSKLSQAIDLYTSLKPEFMVSHECPIELVQFLSNPNFTKLFGYDTPIIKTKTNTALQAMFEAHKPKYWIFGHYHKRWEKEIDGCKFICLDMIRETNYKNCYIDFDKVQTEDDYTPHWDLGGEG